ncbi:hypothetical protein QBC39DRAFT_383088, partial [Podospora conica]
MPIKYPPLPLCPPFFFSHTTISCHSLPPKTRTSLSHLPPLSPLRQQQHTSTMKLSAFITAALQLATLAVAGPVNMTVAGPFGTKGADQYTDFWIYGGTVTGPEYSIERWPEPLWAFFPIGQPACEDWGKGPMLYQNKDVSGDKQGVACDGDGCLEHNWDPFQIDRLEINANNNGWGHYTWYKNRNNHLVDLQDRVVGTCTPLKSGGAPLLCTDKVPEQQFKATIDMKHYFHCETTAW